MRYWEHVKLLKHTEILSPSTYFNLAVENYFCYPDKSAGLKQQCALINYDTTSDLKITADEM